MRRRLGASAALAAFLARTVLRSNGGRPVTPSTISFLVTNRCALSCAHCFYHRELGRTDVRELDLAEYAQLAAHLDPFAVGLFCGGEPFQRTDLAELVGLLRARCGVPVAAVCTNGQPTRSILRQTEAMLRDAPDKLLVLSMSLDGFADTHDRIRGEGTFSRALHTYAACRALAARHDNLLLAVTTVVSAINQHEAAAFVRWVSQNLRPAVTHVLLARQSPRSGEALKHVDPSRYAEAQQAALQALEASSWLGRLQPSWRAADAIRRAVSETMATGQRAFHCHAGTHGAWIDYKGDVHACEVLDEQDPATRIGNLRDVGMDFRALWQGERADRARALVNRHPACASCTHETVGLLPSLAFPPNRGDAIHKSTNDTFRALARRFVNL